MPIPTRKAKYVSIEQLAIQHLVTGEKWSPYLAQMQRFYGRGGTTIALKNARRVLQMVDPKPMGTATARFKGPSWPPPQQFKPKPRIGGLRASIIIHDEVGNIFDSKTRR